MKLTYLSGAAALMLPIACLSAQKNDTAASEPASSGQGFFAYADYFQYSGVDATGAYVNRMNTVADGTFQKNIDSFAALTDSYTATKPQEKTPKGDVTGGTIGYQFTAFSTEKFVISGSYRSGTIDYSSGITQFKGAKTVAASGSMPAYTLNSLINMSKGYSQDNDEYRLNLSWYPSKLDNYVIFGVEYAHCSYDCAYSVYMAGGFYTTNLSDSTVWAYKFATDATSDDVVLHTTFKTHPITLFTTSAGTFGVTPRIDLGFGYSMRDADKVKFLESDDGKKYTQDGNAIGQDTLKKDSWIFEGTATLGLFYQMSSSTFVLDAGYRYKTDVFSDSDFDGMDQKGLYARLGYSYSW